MHPCRMETHGRRGTRLIRRPAASRYFKSTRPLPWQATQRTCRPRGQPWSEISSLPDPPQAKQRMRNSILVSGPLSFAASSFVRGVSPASPLHSPSSPGSEVSRAQSNARNPIATMRALSAKEMPELLSPPLSPRPYIGAPGFMIHFPLGVQALPVKAHGRASNWHRLGYDELVRGHS